MTAQSDVRKRWDDYRPTKATWLWSCVACVAATLAVGFFYAGWVTSGEATEMSARAAARARVDMAASVCVSRFVTAPDAATQLAAFRKTDPWARTKLLLQGGWTTLPGVNDPVQDPEAVTTVGDLCAQRLATATLPDKHADARL